MALEPGTLKGDRKAQLAVIEYSEFECPFCGRFSQDTWPKLSAKYVDTGKVLWVYRHLPLEAIHKNALRAAEAAECAGEQGRFWEMRAVLFKKAPLLEEANLAGYAKEAGVDLAAFGGCMRDGRASKVRAHMAGARDLGVSGTPGFLVGRLGADGRVTLMERIDGAVPTAQFEQTIDRLLALTD